MYLKEKQIVVSLAGIVLTYLFYSLYIYNHYIAGNLEILNDFRFWGKSFLVLIPIAIVVQIIISIIFAIINKILTDEDIPARSDERDKLIELKAIRVSHWIFTAGFGMAMGSLAMGMKPATMFLLLMSSVLLASVTSEIVKLIYYRRGF